MLSPALRYLRSDPARAEGVGLLRRQNGRTWEFFTSGITFVERNRAGRVIHMAGRALDGKARLKYLFLPGLPKPVYGLARLTPSRPVFVVEGIVDYVMLWQWGYQAVATLGTSIKAQDARRLARAAGVMFVPDRDEAGEAAAARWREAVGHGLMFRLPLGAEDVNDLDILSRMGTFVRIYAGGLTIFSTRAMWAKLGVPQQSARQLRYRRPLKDLVPRGIPEWFRSTAQRARDGLNAVSVEVAFLHPCRWIGYRDWSGWLADFQRIQAERA